MKKSADKNWTIQANLKKGQGHVFAIDSVGVWVGRGSKSLFTAQTGPKSA